MSDKGLRLFLAADIPAEAKKLIANAVERSRGDLAGARWVRAENLHLTLKFIGAYPEEGLGSLSNELRESCSRCEPFEAALGGCGAFPSPARARILWVALYEGMEGAQAVARKLDARLEKSGVEREGRPWRGHITLARLKQPGDCGTVLGGLEAELAALPSIAFKVDEVVLYRSILGPQGPTYVALERIALGGKQHE